MEINQKEESHHVHAEPDKDVYVRALERALTPSPSTALGGFPILQRSAGGLRPREFSILCGATGAGKTTFLANLSAGLLANDVPHFVASVETGPEDYLLRVLSAASGIDINHGDPVKEDIVEKIHADHNRLVTKGNLNLSLYENRFSVDTLKADILWHVKEKGCKIAMVDNLNFFMEVTRASDTIVEMDRVIHDLIIFCKTVDVHVIMVMHPKKTEHGRVESEFDIKGSSTAVQEAHNVFLFNRPSKSMIDAGVAEPSDRELKIAKMRRRGLAVGQSIILRQINGVRYEERPRVYRI